MKISAEHFFPGINPDEFARLWDDPEVFERVLRGIPGYKEREILEQTHDDDYMRRKIKYTIDRQIPRFARRLIKPHMLSWTEETVYNKKERVYRARFIPQYFSDQVGAGATIKLQEEGRGGTRRISEGTIQVKIPGLGRLAERFVVKTAEEIAEIEYRLTRKEVEEYIKNRGQG